MSNEKKNSCTTLSNSFKYKNIIFRVNSLIMITVGEWYRLFNFYLMQILFGQFFSTNRTVEIFGGHQAGAETEVAECVLRSI